MELIIHQSVNVKDILHLNKIISKKYTTDFLPCVGDKISDSLWKNPYNYKIVERYFNYMDDCCDVYLEQYTLDTEKQFKSILDIVELHGWTK